MNDADRVKLLREAVESHGSQAKVGRILGYSSTSISQALSNSYGGSLETLLTKVEECFGNQIIDCPIFGKIKLPKCVKERRRPFSSGNPFRVRVYRQCRQCTFNVDREDLETV